MYARVGLASGGSGRAQPAFASESACSLPGMSVWPGIQRTWMEPCAAVISWNLTKADWDESDAVPRRQVAAARLSKQTTIGLSDASGILTAARRPSGAPTSGAKAPRSFADGHTVLVDYISISCGTAWELGAV